MTQFQHLITQNATIHDTLKHQKYCRVSADQIPLAGVMPEDWGALRAAYKDLPADEYLPDGASYRFRRFDSFEFLPTEGTFTLLPHRDYFQSTAINQVTGGIVRQFAPLTPALQNNAFMQALMRWNFAQFPLHDATQSQHRWRIDVHLIHVIAEAGNIAQPTPEGIHRDGAEFVTVHLAQLENAGGGAVGIYDDGKQPITSFTLDHIMDSYLFDDTAIWHGVQPIRPIDDTQVAQRGILTFDYHYEPEETTT